MANQHIDVLSATNSGHTHAAKGISLQEAPPSKPAPKTRRNYCAENKLLLHVECNCQAYSLFLSAGQERPRRLGTLIARSNMFDHQLVLWTFSICTSQKKSRLFQGWAEAIQFQYMLDVVVEEVGPIKQGCCAWRTMKDGGNAQPGDGASSTAVALPSACPHHISAS